jgi:hypothetical protein
MAKQTSRQRKHVKRFNSLGRATLRLNFKKRSEPVIPDAVLRKLAALNLPPNPWVYDVCLRELMRGSNAT